MATFTADAAQTGVQPRALRVGTVFKRSDFSFDGFSSSIGTVVHMLKIPAHAKIAYMDFVVNVTGEYTLQVGDSVNGERFRSTSTYSAGVGVVRPNAVQLGYSYSADDTVIVKFSLVSVVTLGGGAHMNVIFSMDS